MVHAYAIRMRGSEGRAEGSFSAWVMTGIALPLCLGLRGLIQHEWWQESLFHFAWGWGVLASAFEWWVMAGIALPLCLGLRGLICSISIGDDRNRSSTLLGAEGSYSALVMTGIALPLCLGLRGLIQHEWWQESLFHFAWGWGVLFSMSDDRNCSSTLLGREHTHHCAELMAAVAAVRVQDGSFYVGSDSEYARACGYGSFARWETLDTPKAMRMCGMSWWRSWDWKPRDVWTSCGVKGHKSSHRQGDHHHSRQRGKMVLQIHWHLPLRCTTQLRRHWLRLRQRDSGLFSPLSFFVAELFSKAWYFVCQFATAAWLNCAALVPCVEHLGRSPKCRNCKSNFKERQVRGVCCRVRQHFLDGGNGWPKMPEARSTIRALRDMCKEAMMLTGAAREKLLQWRARLVSSQTTWQRACFPQRGRHGESTAGRVGASQCKWFGRCPAFPQEWTSLRDDCGRRRERRVCSRPSEPWDRHRRRNEIAIEADESL